MRGGDVRIDEDHIIRQKRRRLLTINSSVPGKCDGRSRRPFLTNAWIIQNAREPGAALPELD